MTENDEGAVSTDGSYVLRSDHERIVTALRARLAAAEASSNEWQEKFTRIFGEREDARDERDQALARLGEAEKVLGRISTASSVQSDFARAEECQRIAQEFLSRDSAGGMEEAKPCKHEYEQIGQQLVCIHCQDGWKKP